MWRPSRSSEMGYQIRIEGDGAVTKPHGRPVCQAGSAFGERRGGRRTQRSSSVPGWIRTRGRKGREKNPYGRPVCRAGSVLGGRRVGEETPTVVQCVVPDPYEGGDRG